MDFQKMWFDLKKDISIQKNWTKKQLKQLMTEIEFNEIERKVGGNL